MSSMQRNLDDRRWADLVDEARALIPVHASDWTDHNLHDPGITFIELLAWIAEGDIYRVNRVPDFHRLRFLDLVGGRPETPRPARGVVAARLVAGSPPTVLPAGTELRAEGPAGEPIALRTREPLTAVAGRLAAVLHGAGDMIADLTDRWARGEPIRPFGADPRPGAAFHLGFELPAAMPAGLPLVLSFLLADARAGERARLVEAEREASRACRPTFPNPCAQEPCRPSASRQPARLRHHDVVLLWEMFSGGQLACARRHRGGRRHPGVHARWPGRADPARRADPGDPTGPRPGAGLPALPAARRLLRCGARAAGLRHQRCRGGAGASGGDLVLGDRSRSRAGRRPSRERRHHPSQPHVGRGRRHHPPPGRRRERARVPGARLRGTGGDPARRAERRRGATRQRHGIARAALCPVDAGGRRRHAHPGDTGGRRHGSLAVGT